MGKTTSETNCLVARETVSPDIRTSEAVSSIDLVRIDTRGTAILSAVSAEWPDILTTETGRSTIYNERRYARLTSSSIANFTVRPGILAEKTVCSIQGVVA